MKQQTTGSRLLQAYGNTLLAVIPAPIIAMALMPEAHSAWTPGIVVGTVAVLLASAGLPVGMRYAAENTTGTNMSAEDLRKREKALFQMRFGMFLVAAMGIMLLSQSIRA